MNSSDTPIGRHVIADFWGGRHFSDPDILISTYDTPCMLDEALVRQMKPDAVIVDVTCGYGEGYLPTCNAFTSHREPFFERFGILHCKVDAMPASVPLTATEAMSSNAAPYFCALAEDVMLGKEDPVSRSGLLSQNYEILHPEALRHISLDTKRLIPA